MDFLFRFHLRKLSQGLAIGLALIVSSMGFALNANAQIFGGFEVEYGACLGDIQEGDENYELCKNVDCSDPQNEDETILCTSEAAAGTSFAGDTLETTGLTGTSDFGDFIKKLVNFALPYLTLAAFLGYVVAGVMYITAAGNDEQVGKAKKILLWSTIGLVLVILSFSITRLFTQDLVEGLNPDQ